jgi:hypothetical protein
VRYRTEPFYSYRRPPVMLIPHPPMPFVCAVCHEPGLGPPNSKVHPGWCHTEWGRIKSLRNAHRRRDQKRGLA